MIDNAADDVVTECFSLLMRLAKEPKYYGMLHDALTEIFLQKPRFATEAQVIKVTQEWSRDSDPAVRKHIVNVLGILAEDKIDSKETLLLELGSESKVAKIVGTNIEKKETTEGSQAYLLLQNLSEDASSNVREEAKAVLDHVTTRLADKEHLIDARIFERRIFEPINSLRNFVSYIEKPKMRMGSNYPEKNFDMILGMKNGKEFFIEVKFLRKGPHNEIIRKLMNVAETSKVRHPETQFILILNNKPMIEDEAGKLERTWDYIFDEHEWLHFVTSLSREQSEPLAGKQADTKTKS